jgi:threonine dehydratase
MNQVNAPSIDDIRNAAVRVAPYVLRFPVIRLNLLDAPGEIYLKLENLQPIGSYKLRGAGNALLSAESAQLQGGICTASAGNLGQAMAWFARQLDIGCAVIVPEHAPEVKLRALRRYGATTIKVPYDEWWRTIRTGQFPSHTAHFIHPVFDPHLIAGHGTIGLEILQDVQDATAVVIPYGGGAMTSGIGAAIRALKPDTHIFAAEVETGAPLQAALKVGAPTEVNYTPSFVDGIGGKNVLEEMWPLVRSVVRDSIVVSLEQVVDAIRILVDRHHVIAEGAGAAALAAALTGHAGDGKIVCIISGGNIDFDVLSELLLDDVAADVST